MTQDSRSGSPLFTQLDISATSSAETSPSSPSEEHTRLLRDMLVSQDRTNELLEELVSHLGAAQRQRATELGQWKQSNPRLARGCRKAADVLNRVQTEFLQSITDEINADPDGLMQGEFVLNEFIDRFGPRLAHLNGVLQVLAQLGASPNNTNS